MYAFFKPIPFDDTLEASDLKIGKIGPKCLLPLAILGTVSTITDDVSCAPSSANLSPAKKYLFIYCLI